MVRIFTIARYLSISFEYLCPVVFKSHGSGASLTEEQNFSDPNLKCVTAHGIPSKNFC